MAEETDDKDKEDEGVEFAMDIIHVVGIFNTCGRTVVGTEEEIPEDDGGNDIHPVTALVTAATGDDVEEDDGDDGIEDVIDKF